MDSIHTNSGERLTFYKLFSEKKYAVEIPIIQRDYAQGRVSTYEVRDLFLEALHTYLEENLPERDLDFVYGSLVNDNGIKFIPLDGQQRLTTLFLLHWYLSNLSGNGESFQSVMIDNNGHSKFSYETRASAREFCTALLKYCPDFKNLQKSDKELSNSLSKTIKNEGWYYLSWKFDPTIQSMLTMLDALHSRFSTNEEYYDRLINNENPIITFLFLNLNDFKLTDDLYIKMNSRGKPLTQFENFKAKFEQYLSEVTTKDKYILQFNEVAKEVSLREYFSFKIDIDWANLFWNYKALVPSKINNIVDNTFDDELMNFFRVIFANIFARDYVGQNYLPLEYLIGTQVARREKNYSDTFTFNKFKELNALSDNAVIFLVSSLDALTNSSERIKIYLKDKFFFNEGRIFEQTLKNEITLPQRVQLHAYISFLIEKHKSPDGFYHWMRLVHNLTENTVIDSAEHVSRALKSLESILPFSNTIIDKLNEYDLKLDFFYAPQLMEEKIKACLIKKSKLWEDSVMSAEKHPYFLGQIGFILEFSGIVDYYHINKNCNWSVDDDLNYHRCFTNYTAKAAASFNYVIAKESSDALWERAVLTKGDYLIDASQWRKNFLSVNRYHRDYSWKRLLRFPTGSNPNELLLWTNRRFLVKELLDDDRFDLKNLKESLTEIIKDEVLGWRKNFIANPFLIQYSQQGFIKFESDSKILLYKESQQNHRHREMYSYNLYVNWLRKNIKYFEPFKTIDHIEVRSGDEYSCVSVSNWSIDKKYFAINIYFDADQTFHPNNFEIKFYKTKGILSSSEYPERLINVLDNENLLWDENTKGYWTSVKTENEVLNYLISLCKSLQLL